MPSFKRVRTHEHLPSPGAVVPPKLLLERALRPDDGERRTRTGSAPYEGRANPRGHSGDSLCSLTDESFSPPRFLR